MMNDARWEAVATRDRRADGTFVFAVQTTGIYCRPSCPARRPRRSNVRFFPLPGAAAAAGFRACRRCHPDRIEPVGDVRTVRDACRVLHRGEGGTVAATARTIGKSPAQLRRAFKAVLGVTPGTYRRTLVRSAVRDRLQRRESITGAQYGAGLSSSSRLYETAGDFLGMTPGRYRDGGADTTIRYGFGRTSLGQVIVATTDRGVCAVHLGETRDALEHRLGDEFPNASLVREDAAVDVALTRVMEAIDRGGPTPDLALDIQATAFQARVWCALKQVPRGETRTYLDIARAIGAPRAVRAVAGACAANPVAVVIPCHRVVRRDGGLAGYRWGEDRKRGLLQRERPDRPSTV